MSERNVGIHMIAVMAGYLRQMADSPIYYPEGWKEGDKAPPEPSWLMGAAEHLRDYHEIMVEADAVRGAIFALSPAVKTRDIGRCKQCGKSTPSGLDQYCDRCAINVLTRFATLLERGGTTGAANNG